MDYERWMACAVGEMRSLPHGDIYVCVDGPVFNYAVARPVCRTRKNDECGY